MSCDYVFDALESLNRSRKLTLTEHVCENNTTSLQLVAHVLDIQHRDIRMEYIVYEDITSINNPLVVSTYTISDTECLGLRKK